MAVTRRSTEEMANNVRILLNRPDEDDLLDFPEAYFMALSQAHRWMRREISKITTEVLSADGPFLVTTADSGVSYDLGDTFVGPIGVWEPPGPPTGIPLFPALPEQARAGFWVEGTTLHLTQAREYSPGLYVTGVKFNAPALAADANHTLPEYCEDAMELRAAYLLAETPGMAVDAMRFKRRFLNEWTGDREDPSDTGILGILKKRYQFDGIETAVDEVERPWWRGIGG